MTLPQTFDFDRPITSFLSAAGVSAPMFPRLELKRCPSMDTLSKGGRHFAWRLTSKALPADTISPQLHSSLTCLERSIWYAACYCSTRMKHGDEREDVVVNQMLDSSGMRYAVIAGLRTETGPERLVIAYANEKSLRDFIAAPSIIAVDFSSREHGCDRRRKTAGPVRSARARVLPS